MQFAIELYAPMLLPQNMVVQGTGQRRKYGGAGDRSIFGHENMVVQGTGRRKYGGAGDRCAENMVVQGTGAPKIWWCRGQVSRKEQNMVVQGTGQSGNMVVQGTGQNSKASLSNSFQHFLRLSL